MGQITWNWNFLSGFGRDVLQKFVLSIYVQKDSDKIMQIYVIKYSLENKKNDIYCIKLFHCSVAIH